jgi:hypothetical protein
MAVTWGTAAELRRVGVEWIALQSAAGAVFGAVAFWALGWGRLALAGLAAVPLGLLATGILHEWRRLNSTSAPLVAFAFSAIAVVALVLFSGALIPLASPALPILFVGAVMGASAGGTFLCTRSGVLSGMAAFLALYLGTFLILAVAFGGPVGLLAMLGAVLAGATAFEIVARRAVPMQGAAT